MGKKRIFISHASADGVIGEKLVDTMEKLGIDKNDVFFSSQYGTGIQLGNDFHKAIKEALTECDIVIFLLTKKFYKSAYCLNEMGAVWYLNKKFIPILLDNLTYDDMLGFIDKRYSACKLIKSESYMLFNELLQYKTLAIEITDIQAIFDDFITTANEISKQSSSNPIETTDKLSDIENMILTGKLTDGEILLLNYFVEIQCNYLEDCTIDDFDEFGNHASKETDDLRNLNIYVSKYNFDLSRAKHLLEQSDFFVLKYNYVSDYRSFGDYCGCELRIDIFRDLRTISPAAKDYINRIKTSCEVASPVNINIKQINNNTENETDIEKLILSRKFKEIDALLLKYMIDTSTMSLGDRWMADGQKASIRLWENENELDDTLSRNYDVALKTVIYRSLMDVASETSYGNPREYKLKEPYITQLQNLSPKAEAALENVFKKHRQEDELPF